MAVRVRQPPITPINPIKKKKKKNSAPERQIHFPDNSKVFEGHEWAARASLPPGRAENSMLAFQPGRRGAHALSVGTLTLIQHDLLIYFHGGNDVNGSILMPVLMEIRGNINAAGC